jgi:hypothetical protein
VDRLRARGGVNASERGPRRTAFSLLLGVTYAVALIWPFRAYFPRFGTHLIGDHGDALLLHLHCAWQWEAIAEGRFAEILSLPTMHPYSTGFAFGETLLGITLPLAPIHWLSGSTAATFNVAVVLSFMLLFVAVFGWVREIFDSRAAGLLAAMTVVFVPWRIHYHSALNVLTVHYAVFGMWLLWRWLRRPSWRALMGAMLLFYVQVVTAAQVALAAIYLTGSWMTFRWVFSGFRIDSQRVVQVAVATLAFAALCAPWLSFFAEAFNATPGLMRTTEMAAYSAALPGMARVFGATGVLGALAAVGAVLWLAAHRRGLGFADVRAEALALTLGAALLFAIARGPLLGSESDPTALPGYYALRWFPLLDALRAPVRLAAMTPIVLSIWAGAAIAIVERMTRAWLGGRAHVGLALAPLMVAGSWFSMPAPMAAPIDQRPQDLALAKQLSDLPSDAVILPLPLDPEPSGAAVDEWVLVHRRAQIGGFASIVPEPFRRAMVRLGQWPSQGHEAAHALGATHLVVPTHWLGGAGDLDVLSRVQQRAIIRVNPTAPPPNAKTAYSERVPATADLNHWMTLALFPDRPQLDLRGHFSVPARWSAPGPTVTAHAFFPGIADPEQPVRIWVPTPSVPAHYTLEVDYPGHALRASVDVRESPTSANSPLRDVRLTLTIPPARPVRVGEAFPIGVEIRTGEVTPILLATSRQTFPERRGEVVAAIEYRMRSPKPGLVASVEVPARMTLARDLGPGEVESVRWDLRAPPLAGEYTAFARLRARGIESEAAWFRLTDLEVR